MKPKLKEETKLEVVDINPRFRDRLDPITDDLANKLLHLKPLLTEAAVTLGEVRDFIAFEVQKVKLRMAEHDWQDIVDVQVVAADKKWLKTLETILEEFTVERLMASHTAIDELFNRLDDTFGA
jgi:hypothetical protein